MPDKPTRRRKLELKPQSDEEILREEVIRLAKAGWGLVVHLDVSQVTSLITLIQCAIRHPGVTHTELGRRAVPMGRYLQDGLADVSPELARIFERGWHEVFDTPREQDGDDSIEFDDLDPNIAFTPNRYPEDQDTAP